MNSPLFIAKRYFSTKKNSNFVHLISWVSLLGVAIGTAALILVLSVFNGFEDLVLQMYNSFDPHLQITATEGKVFNPEKISAVLDNPEFESSEVMCQLEFPDSSQSSASELTSKSYSTTASGTPVIILVDDIDSEPSCKVITNEISGSVTQAEQLWYHLLSLNIFFKRAISLTYVIKTM